MNPKVSILVPVYNMESYLPRCLDSLRSQTLTDIEIIAVNDGSTDNSLQILKAYARTDCRIIVVDRCNGGVSAARNEAIRLARGEYIGCRFCGPNAAGRRKQAAHVQLCSGGRI